MRTAVLGLGSAGRRHADLLAKAGHEVVTFDPAVPGGAASAEEAVAASEAVVVASPSALHAAHVRACLDAGRPFLVEKPLAVRGAEAAELAARARQAGIVAGVAMNWRFHDAIVALRRLLEAGELGVVHYARASIGFDLRQWRPGTDYRTSYSARAELGGGIVLDAIHELDYLLWLLGPAESVVGELGHVSELEIDVEDLAVGAIRFRSGTLATVDLNFFEPAYRRGCLLAGSDAVAEWAWGTGRVVVRREGGEPREIAVSEDVGATYAAELDDFADAVATGGAPRTPLADGAAAVALAEGLKRSAAQGRRISLR